MDEEHNNPDNWKWGLFYFNPADKRILVPKRIPFFGLTINFANPLSTILLVTGLLVLISVVLSIK